MMSRYLMFLGVLLTFAASGAAAAILAHVGQVKEASADLRFNGDGTPLVGGCYVRMTTASPHAECSDFVHFFCSGPTDEVPTVGTKSANTINYQLAQLGYVTGKTVRIASDNTVVINGACYARAITVVN